MSALKSLASISALSLAGAVVGAAVLAGLGIGVASLIWKWARGRDGKGPGQ